MKFSHPKSDIYTPDGSAPDTALARTTHLCVIAHQDDIEINAYPAVAECYGRDDRFFHRCHRYQRIGLFPHRSICRLH